MPYAYKARAKRIEEPRKPWEEEQFVAKHNGVWYRIYGILNPGEVDSTVERDYPYSVQCVLERIEPTLRQRLRIISVLAKEPANDHNTPD